VPSNEQRRQAAKRKLERQLARRAERARRRRRMAVLFSVIGVVIVAAGLVTIFTVAHHSSSSTAAPANGSSPSSSAAAPAQTTHGACKYTSTPSQPAPQGKDVGLPTDPAQTPKTGTVSLDLKTSQGDIPLTLDRAEAPCTVQSMEFLAQKKFFDNTPCHRLTSTDGLKVLQCGDPTGSGSGGPGFTIPDEKPKTLKAAPASAGQGADVYPRGTLAMANTGQPNSGGSQFFLVYGDSYLPPDYTVFGTISATGLSTIDKIAAGGITPGQNPETGAADPTDGKPKLNVTITTATAS
jgi:peptidyl-prolyl cis-trans isomerase B (cyclophilin B)